MEKRNNFVFVNNLLIKVGFQGYSLEDDDSLFNSKIGLHIVPAFEVQIGDRPKI